MKQMEQIHGEYRRDLNHNYLILDNYDTGCEDSYEIRMLEENHLKGLLECQMRNLNGKNQFYYEISSKQPMAGIYDKKALGFEDMYHLCRDLMKTLDETEDYLLDTSRLVLWPEYIYMDVETKEFFFCYLPGFECEAVRGFHQLAEYMLAKLDHQDERGVIVGYEVYKKTTEENYNMEEILELFQDNQTGYIPVYDRDERPVREEPVEREAQAEASDRKEGFFSRLWDRRRRETYMDVEEKGYESIQDEEIPAAEVAEETEYGSTKLLFYEEDSMIHRLDCGRYGIYEQQLKEGEGWTIGKLPEYADVLLNDPKVSRIHARIHMEEGKYYLTDLNSTNGTYLNGVQLGSNEKTEIRRGDEISIAHIRCNFE
ncbi:DUF6382 domain-containing protein [Diplocloster agilis]|uniref:FHA domain-containing protein n=1 Tax=Diplocloster agilis TaxID=2850323 RepID=A0A949NA66_9FIRM|nr:MULTISPECIES: DUF6382 domain-containing protein [Lachnospiraceae]MBU9736142.1 FHA domain-containing protein [Diplocloster agilis]MCU6732157.1 FHA domain-containing protein [Suonthocola fibrivorans]